MSLINKMLQDLDARGGNGPRSASASDVRPVSYAPSRAPLTMAIGVGAAVLVLAAGGYFGWKIWLGRPHAPQPAAAPVAAVPAADPEKQRAAGLQLAQKMEARNAAARRAAEQIGSSAMPAQAAGPQAAAAAQTAVAKPEQVVGLASVPQAGNAAAAASVVLTPGSGKRQAGGTHATIHTGGAAKKSASGSERTATALAREKEMARVLAATAKPQGNAVASAQDDAGLSAPQRAENEYRRALAKLQEGRISDAMAGLEQALSLYPRHEAARETLVSLLVENGRTADATRHLLLATSIDPRQTSMAMLLARLQLEQGGDALATLSRSLPYAEANPEYHALMAGVLQRANRHREAAEQYQSAVRLQPANGVWWMGLGISLQAEKRAAEARSAFERARDSGRLTPELQSFVERRLQQLGN